MQTTLCFFLLMHLFSHPTYWVCNLTKHFRLAYWRSRRINTPCINALRYLPLRRAPCDSSIRLSHLKILVRWISVFLYNLLLSLLCLSSPSVLILFINLPDLSVRVKPLISLIVIAWGIIHSTINRCITSRMSLYDFLVIYFFRLIPLYLTHQPR